MSTTTLAEALEALTGRLEALTGDGTIYAGRDRLALAFVGLDLDVGELIDTGTHVIDPYAASIISASTEAWERLDTDEEMTAADVFSVGAGYGQHVGRNILGAFCVGVLLGELHRQRTIEREATSDG
jgi:hypothetical protein